MLAPPGSEVQHIPTSAGFVASLTHRPPLICDLPYCQIQLCAHPAGGSAPRELNARPLRRANIGRRVHARHPGEQPRALEPSPLDPWSNRHRTHLMPMWNVPMPARHPLVLPRRGISAAGESAVRCPRLAIVSTTGRPGCELPQSPTQNSATGLRRIRTLRVSVPAISNPPRGMTKTVLQTFGADGAPAPFCCPIQHWYFGHTIYPVPLGFV